MSYKSDCPISEPNHPNIRNRKELGGFGWHPDFGMYIPVVSEDDKIEGPYPSGMVVKKIPNG
jgi:hypothetical protein